MNYSNNMKSEKNGNHNVGFLTSKKTIKRNILRGTLTVFSILYFSVSSFSLQKKSFPMVENSQVEHNDELIDYETALLMIHESNDVIAVLKENNKLSKEEKEYIFNFINDLKINKPELDMRIFKENLKELDIIGLDSDKYNTKFPKTTAYFDVNHKIIFYNNKYRLEDFIDHELGHLLINIYFEKDKKAFYNQIQFGNYHSLEEGFNTVFTNDLKGINTNNYIKEQSYIKILSEILGSQQIEKYFLNGKGNELITSLEAYSTKEEIERTFSLMENLFLEDTSNVSNFKEISINISNELLKWSRLNALCKYNQFKEQGYYDDEIEEAYINQLIRTDLFLIRAFEFTSEEMRQLEINIKSSDEELYDKYLNDPEVYAQKLKENSNFVYSRHYFVNSTDQITFEYLEKNAIYNNNHK